MIKLKHFLAILFVISLISCKDDKNPYIPEPFDHKGQAVKDEKNLVKFLSNHYFDATSREVKILTSGKTPLLDDKKLITKDIKENNINYKLYYYPFTEGKSTKKITVIDSVFVNYKGVKIEDGKLGSKFDENTKTWFTLADVIRGWSYALPNFKAGINNSVTKIKYKDYGQGILFVPSGLAYRNKFIPGIGQNKNLMFYIDLLDVKENTDHDNDNVPSILEDVNGDGKPWNDDTDGDGIPNFKDSDDDNDGKPTKTEDANKDGDPRNDFSSGAKVPDYLNSKV